MDVAHWLRNLGLERYEATFSENDVNAQLLPNLTADDLKDLGIASVGHRRQLLEAIATLRVKETPDVEPSPSLSPAANAGLPRSHRRTPPAQRDVLRSHRLDRPFGTARPRGSASGHGRLSPCCH